MHFSPLVDRVANKGASVWSIHFDAERQRAEGRDVIVLTIGDPDQLPPQAVIDATIGSLQRRRTRYSPFIGHPELRTAVAARVARRTGRPCSAENIAIVPGAQAGLYCTIQCIAGLDDELIIPEPMYATYEAVVGASGGRIVNVPLRSENGFHVEIEAIERALTPRTRVVWINTPHNPTGAVLSAGEVKEIAGLCHRHGLWLVSDEVYEDLAFNGAFASAWGLSEQSVVISSLSKSHAIPGFRVGWVAGPAQLVSHMTNLVICMLYGGPAFIQDGALAAVGSDLPEVAKLREDYRRRSILLAGILATAPGCRITAPEGGLFLMLDVRGTGLGAESFARALLEREGVATFPCDGFGPSGVGHIRISLAAEDRLLVEGGKRIVRFASALGGHSVDQERVSIKARGAAS